MVVLGAAFNENAAALLPAFVQQYRPTFPVGHSTPDPVYRYLRLSYMKVNLVPMMAFIDRDGTIRSQYTGEAEIFRSNERQNISKILESLLKEPADKKKPAK